MDVNNKKYINIMRQMSTTNMKINVLCISIFFFLCSFIIEISCSGLRLIIYQNQIYK